MALQKEISMGLKTYCLIVWAALILTACSTPQLATSLKTNASALENNGEYEAAVNSWEQYFMQTPLEEVAGVDFAAAAKAAFKAENVAKAIQWFDQARYKEYGDAEMYLTLAEIYRAQQNISKEMSALETYSSRFEANNSAVNARLFALNVEIGLMDEAKRYWTLMDESARSREENLVDYLSVSKKLGDDATADSVATEIIAANPRQFDALEWLAKKYYWAGQNRYKRAMAKYEQNKTRKQYKILLEELDNVTSDFKKALPYLEKLWEQKPGKEYAAYFANIYARFGDKTKAEFYGNYSPN